MGKTTQLKTGAVDMKGVKRFMRLAKDDSMPEVGKLDLEARTITIPFSSEAAVPTYYGTEILSHATGAPNLDRLNTGAPLLYNHNPDDLLGIVEKAWLGTDKRCYATVRFGKDDRGTWAMQQVQDQILVNASFWYDIYAIEVDTEADTYTATDWSPTEVSLVTIPADTSVGVGRSKDGDPTGAEPQRQTEPTAAAAATTPEPEESETMKHKRTHVLQDQATEHATGGGAPAAAPQVDPAVAETARVTEIKEMCRSHNIDDKFRDVLINLKMPIEEARGIVADHLLGRNQRNAAMGASDIGLTDAEKAGYSLFKAIRAMRLSQAKHAEPWKDAGFEREVSQAYAQRTKKETDGIFMPTDLPFYIGRQGARAYDYSIGTGAGLSANSGGATLVATDLLAASFIDVLRNKCRVLGMGAQILSGLVGNVDIPRQKAQGQAYWVTEGNPPPQSGAQFDKISLTPKTAGMLANITRSMMQQATPAVEMMVRQDMLAVMALLIDGALLYGTGQNGQPLGIANQAGIGSISGGANGSAITIDDLIDLETAITSRNADGDNMAYIANAVTVGALKKLKSTTGQYLWTNLPNGQRSMTPGEINGYTVARTNQARSNLTKGTSAGVCSEIYMGDWSEAIVGEWGTIELVPNPYASGIFEAGGLQLRVLQTLDTNLRHVESFAMKTDVLTS